MCGQLFTVCVYSICGQLFTVCVVLFTVCDVVYSVYGLGSPPSSGQGGVSQPLWSVRRGLPHGIRVS
jgi:hypothetical protein